MRARLALAALALLATGSLPGTATAQTCAVASTPLVFGQYTSPGGARVDSSASVTVTCTPAYLLLACSVGYTLSLSHGGTGTPGNRQLAAGAGRLSYGLFSDAARTQPWGDGGADGAPVGANITTSLLGLVCLPGVRAHTVHGRLPANQNVPPGSYSDTVVLTITW